MKYLLSIISTPFGEESNISTTSDNENFVSFPAVAGNPNYDAFLEQAKLTDTQVKALKPDTWYDFPKENK